jgi:NAD:arginine ADP-ribosyltransferase
MNIRYFQAASKSFLFLSLVILGNVSSVSSCKARRANQADATRVKATTDIGENSTIDLGQFINKDDRLKTELRDLIGADIYKNEINRFKHLNSYKASTAFQKLPDEDIVGIVAYTDEQYYSVINRALRNQDRETLKSLRPLILACASGLNRLPRARQTVVRGARLPAAAIKAYREAMTTGKAFIQREFLSTTADDEVPEAFIGNTIYKIKSQTGHSISAISKFPDENEVLFSPGSEFKVRKVYENGPAPKLASLTGSSRPNSPAYMEIFGGSEAIGLDDFPSEMNLGEADQDGLTVIEMDQIK